MKAVSTSAFKRVQIHWKRKKVIRFITDDLGNFSDSDETDEE